jgi:hypothetical protein
MCTINYREEMAESMKFKRSLFCQGKGTRLNKTYPYGKQAQVQYINLEWMNEIGKKMWHKVYKEK